MTIIEKKPPSRIARLGPLLVLAVLSACAKPDRYMERSDVGTPAAGGRGGASGAGGASGIGTGGSTGLPSSPGETDAAAVGPTGEDAALTDLVIPGVDAPGDLPDTASNAGASPDSSQGPNPCAGPCSVVNGTGSCKDGQCSIEKCSTGFADCTVQPGCETPVTTVDRCGACDVRCAQGEACVEGRCQCAGTLCGGTCVELSTDSLNCGECRRACAGGCVAKACQCVGGNPANLMRNGGFDRDVSQWSWESVLAVDRSGEDASSCVGSGSATVSFTSPMKDFQPDLYQCTSQVTPRQRYNVGAWVKCLPNSPPSRVHLWVSWYGQPSCANQSSLRSDPKLFPLNDLTSSWRHIANTLEAPEGTTSAMVRLTLAAEQTSVTPITCVFDMVYLTAAPGAW